MDYCLIYLSASTEIVSPQILSELTRQSKIRNQQLGITGLLVYMNGSSLHILEGAKEKVLSEFEIIRRDLRHRQVTVLFEYPISERLFDDFDINYRVHSSSRLDTIERLKELPNPIWESSRLVVSIIRTFYNENIRN